jgi:sulfide:quinone oxidoreductase
MTQRIVVVGGGTGGTVLTNRLTDRLRTELDRGTVELTLVTDDPEQTYKPVFLYVAFGEKTLEDARRPVRDLVDWRRVDLRIDRVTDVDTDGKRVRLDADGWLAYDYLVLATGAQIVPETVPGLPEGGHNFYSPDGAQDIRQALAGFTEGRLVMSVVGVPHMCPAAPLEFVFMADAWFRERGLRDQVDVTYTYPIQRAHGLRPVAEWATDLLEERDIELLTFVNPEEIDPDAQTIHTAEGEEIAYDLLAAIPPHTGGDIVQASGLGDGNWIAVDSHTLEAENADDVYALGDVADLPTSKAGSVAHYAAGVVADRLACRVRGVNPTATFDGKTICFIETGMDEATFIAFDYDTEPQIREPSQLLHWGKLGYNELYWLTARGLL